MPIEISWPGLPGSDNRGATAMCFRSAFLCDRRTLIIARTADTVAVRGTASTGRRRWAVDAHALVDAVAGADYRRRAIAAALQLSGALSDLCARFHCRPRRKGGT